MKRSVVNEFGERVVVMELNDRGPFTAEEIEMMNNLEGFIDGDDEDCPPISEAMICQMRSDIANKKKAGFTSAKMARAMA